MERGFQNRGVVSGLVGGSGRRFGGWVVGQDKASTVLHGAPARFRRRLGSFSHRERTARTVRTPIAEACKFLAPSPSTRSFSRLLFFAAASAILIAALSYVAGKSGLVLTLTDSSCPVGLYRLLRKPVVRGELVESCLPRDRKLRN